VHNNQGWQTGAPQHVRLTFFKGLKRRPERKLNKCARLHLRKLLS
jgi:hypothetical protein